MIDEATQDQALLYVLGELAPAARDEFERAKTLDADLAAYVAELEENAADLALLATPKAPAPELRESILASVREADMPPTGQAALHNADQSAAVPAKSGSITNIVPWALAACAAVAAVCLGLQFNSARHDLAAAESTLEKTNAALSTTQTEVELAEAELAKAHSENEKLKNFGMATTKQLEETQSRLADAADKLAAAEIRADLAQMQVVTLTSKLEADYVASVAWDEEHQRGVLRVTRLPENAADNAYQLWVIDAATEKPISAGIFNLGADGTIRVPFRPVTPVGRVAVFAVSLEKAGGSTSDGPEGEIVLAGSN